MIPGLKNFSVDEAFGVTQKYIKNRDYEELLEKIKVS